MSNFYFGLNTSKNLAEIQDKKESLTNLGLNYDDLEKIRNLSNNSVVSYDARTLANLEEDARRALGAIRAEAGRYDDLTASMPSFRKAIQSNLVLDGKQLLAQAVKYNFYDYNDDPNNPGQPKGVRSADISTSRVSAWSELSAGNIFYGGDVEVTPSGGVSTISVGSLAIAEAPQRKRFPAEVPTHKISVNVNNGVRNLYAMKGIPLKFNGFFRTINIDFTVDGSIGPSVVVKGVEEGDEDIRGRYYNESGTLVGTALSSSPTSGNSLRFYDYRYREKDIELYNRPDGFRRITIPYANISEFPQVTLENLDFLNLSFNDFEEMPDFKTYTPTANEIYINGNDLNRTGVTPNAQVQKLPSTLTHLGIEGTFGGTGDIDLATPCPNLKVLRFNSYASRYIRRISYATNSPAVTNAILEYDVYAHQMSRLHVSVADAPALNSLNIAWNNISRDSNGNGLVLKSALGNGEVVTRTGGVDVTGTGTLRSFTSASNSHNIVNVSGNTNITSYTHSYSRGLYSDAFVDNNFSGKFTGCVNLSSINLYATDVRGSVEGSFQNLQGATRLEVRYTLMHGKLTASSFSGTPKLGTLLFAGSYLGRNGIGGAEESYVTEYDPQTGDPIPLQNSNQWQFFDESNGSIFDKCPNLSWFYCYNNRSIKGALPDLSRNYNLRGLYIPNTNLTIGLEKLNNLPYFYYLNISGSRFETMPSLRMPALQYFYAHNNNFSGVAHPAIDCPNLRYYFLYNNSFIGAVPDVSGCGRLELLLMANNSFNSYVPGSISSNTRLRRLDLTNNSLTRGSIMNLIVDLDLNYNANPRSGVTIQLAGNGVILGDLPSDTVQIIENLISNGWSITI